jgi:hypothetical protein
LATWSRSAAEADALGDLGDAPPEDAISRGDAISSLDEELRRALSSDSLRASIAFAFAAAFADAAASASALAFAAAASAAAASSAALAARLAAWGS